VSRATAGRVILVGAGPGAPDLVTLRGLRALRAADAVVYDALAAPELLDEAPPGALRIDVGKRGHDSPTRPQAEITALLLALAREGRTVVRLKGGDPFVFGRGAEEASACVEAGIPFEVVPGISAGIGALAHAGIPVTDRRHSASFAVVTGHKDPTKVSAETRWAALGRAVDTLVVLMGMRNLDEIVARILAGGRAASTPAAVVMNGSLPSQRVIEAPLGELAARAREAGLHAPAAVVVGDVVQLRASLAWFERRPLFGVRVLLTRDREGAREWIDALRDAGAEPRLAPMIELAPPSDPRPADAALAALDGYDALLFTSANAVRFTAARAAALGIELSAFAGRVACVGPATAEAALRAGLAVHRMPVRRYDAQGLLAELRESLAPAGRRFLLPCAEAARELLPEGLRAAGAHVDAPAVYRTLAPPEGDAGWRGWLAAGELDALVFASPSAARHFAERLDAAERAAAGRCLVAAIGPHTAEALRSLALAPDVTAERPGGAELVAALSERVARERAGGTR
jgi:uroporphyrinogen III methyltransferase/synthase